MQALELMKTHVVKTSPEATLSEAVDLMDIYQVNGLPVVDTEGRLLGMLTEQDVCRALALSDDEWRTRARQAAQLTVRETMTQPAISVSEHSEAQQAARLLLNRSLKRLPVTDDLGRVVGILNRIDVMQALFEGLFDAS